MLRIVNDAANRAKNTGECGTNETSSDEQQVDAGTKTEFSLHVKDVPPNRVGCPARAGRKGLK